MFIERLFIILPLVKVSFAAALLEIFVSGRSGDAAGYPDYIANLTAEVSNFPRHEWRKFLCRQVPGVPPLATSLGSYATEEIFTQASRGRNPIISAKNFLCLGAGKK